LHFRLHIVVLQTAVRTTRSVVSAFQGSGVYTQMQIDCHNRYEKRLLTGLQIHSASDTQTRDRKNISNDTSDSKAEIFDQCAAAHWYDAKGPRVS
jgi:hypothetical protein